MKYYYFQMLLDSVVFLKCFFWYTSFFLYFFVFSCFQFVGSTEKADPLVDRIWSDPCIVAHRPSNFLRPSPQGSRPSALHITLDILVSLCVPSIFCEMLWEMGVSWVRLVVKALPMCEGRATDCSSWGSQPRRRMLEVKLWRQTVIPISSYWRLSIGLCTKHNSMTMHHLFGYDFNVLDHIEAAFFKAMLPSIKASSAPGCL